MPLREIEKKIHSSGIFLPFHGYSLLMGEPHFAREQSGGRYAREKKGEPGDTIAAMPSRQAIHARPANLVRFEQAVLPHLNAAYNLARWLLHNPHDAEDAVQESYLRAFRFFDSFDGSDARAWLLAIVRNRCRTYLQQNARREVTGQLSDDAGLAGQASANPESEALRKSEIDSLRSCLENLPVDYREVIILRDLEQMSYKEVAAAAGIPVGTVMSRLSRARLKLQSCLGSSLKEVKK